MKFLNERQIRIKLASNLSTDVFEYRQNRYYKRFGFRDAFETHLGNLLPNFIASVACWRMPIGQTIKDDITC